MRRKEESSTIFLDEAVEVGPIKVGVTRSSDTNLPQAIIDGSGFISLIARRTGGLQGCAGHIESLFSIKVH
jgi:hypothetical protein